MKRTNEILVGLLLIVGAAIAVVGSIWLVRGSLAQGYPLFARFPWGEGLKPGQPVLLAGVTAGSVADVEYDPTGTVRVRLRMNSGFKVPKGSVVSSIPVGFFGDKAIAIEPPRNVTETVASGDSLAVKAGGATTDNIIATGDSIARDIRGITLPLRQQMADSGGITEIRDLLRNYNGLARQLNSTVTAQNANLSVALASVTRSLRALERTTASLDSLRMDSLSRNAGRSAANVALLTDSLRATIHTLNGALSKLDSGTGTAGKLLSDSLLYLDLRRVTLRVDSVLADFKQNPRRYLKFSVF
jgi:phospholipid/cholesterol/gamma-HCH transport system substrate-binding protein